MKILKAKIPFGEYSIRRNFRWAKVLFGENSGGLKFCLAKIPGAEIPAAKIPSGIIPCAKFDSTLLDFRDGPQTDVVFVGMKRKHFFHNGF